MIRRRFTVALAIAISFAMLGCCGLGEMPASQLRRYENDLLGLTRPQAIAYLQKDRFDSIGFPGRYVMEAHRYTGFCPWLLRRDYVGIEAEFGTSEERVDQVQAYLGWRGP